jgi:hypothetical protein
MKKRDDREERIKEEAAALSPPADLDTRLREVASKRLREIGVHSCAECVLKRDPDSFVSNAVEAVITELHSRYLGPDVEARRKNGSEAAADVLEQRRYLSTADSLRRYDTGVTSRGQVVIASVKAALNAALGPQPQTAPTEPKKGGDSAG